MKEEKLPFTEKQTGDYVVRVFDGSLEDEELKWHFDDENRIVEPIECVGWKLQIDESLPSEMKVGEKYFIPVGIYHRTIKGRGDLKVKVYKLDNEKGDSPVFSRKHLNGSEFSDNLKYHTENNIALDENVFRYGSEAWCDLIQECKSFHESGKLELSDREMEFLEDDPGKIAYQDGKKIILNTPFRNTDGNGYEFFVDVMSESGKIKRVYFNG
jgi:hypothetical protein